MKPVIGMLLDSKFPPDIRVEKEARSLVDAGFDVHLLCRTENNGVEKVTDYHGLTVHHSVPSSYLLNKISSIMLYTTFVNPIWIKEIDKFIRSNKIDVLHVHDLPLVMTALKIKKRYPAVKVVSDFHENYPAAVNCWTSIWKGPKKILAKFIFNYTRWNNYEKEAVDKSDKVIAVVREMKERLLDKHKVDRNKITVVSNYEDLEFSDGSGLRYDFEESGEKYFTALYVGGFGIHRGIDTAILSMKYLKDIPVKLLIIGRGSRDIEKWLHDLVDSNDLNESVEFLGWQPFDKISDYMKKSGVGLVPHHSNEHTDNTIPHKLFQYMMSGIPVLVSSCKPLARYVRETSSGLVFKAGDPEDMAKQLRELYEHRELRSELARSGVNSTLNGAINWQNEGKKLVRFYTEI